MKKGSPVDPASGISLSSWMQDSNMTPESMESYLLEAIELEEQKPVEQQDAAMLAVYEKVLFALRANKPLMTRKEEGRERINTYLHNHSVNRPRQSATRRVLLAFVCMAVIFLGVEVFANREWIFGRTTDDGEQYVIEGDRIDANLLAQGQADTESKHIMITTTSMDEVAGVLGYVPPMPQSIPDGWSLQSINIERTKGLNRFAALYGNLHTKYILKYEIRTYEDAKRASMEFEQNNEGELIQMNGTAIYAFMNTEIHALLWTDKLSVCSIQGPLSNEELMKIATSIK